MKLILYTNEIVGSHLYGINIKNSDIDFFQIYNQVERTTIHKNRNHEIRWGIDEGLNLLLCTYKYYHFELGAGFGEKLIQNSLVEYIEENKENFKYENIGNSFNSFINYEISFKGNLYGEQLYDQIPKLNAYFILYKYIFVNYPKDKILEKYLHPPKEIKDFLIAVRKHEIPYQEVLNFELSLRREIDKVKSFYADRFNEGYAAREKEKMKQIIQNLEN